MEFEESHSALFYFTLFFSSNSKFLIVRFESEADAFSAYRELDGLLAKDMFNGKLMKRLKANLY